MPLGPRVNVCFISSHRSLLSLLLCVPSGGWRAGLQSRLGGRATQGLSLASLVLWSSQLTHESKKARRSPRGTRPTCHRGPAQMPLQPFLSPLSHVPCISQSRSSSWNALLVLLKPQPTFRVLLHDTCLFPRPVPAAPCVSCSGGLAFKMPCPALLLVHETYQSVWTSAAQ